MATEVAATGGVSRVPRSTRLGAIFGLLLLSPICAEYLIGYAESISKPLEMLAGLLILAPLYGTVALLIRDITRRTGRGWPTILLLATAFGLIQAGLIDQSLFSLYDVPGWEAERGPTLVPVLGISVDDLLGFVGGHVIWSFGAPIAVIESCVPQIADRPWLGRAGLIVMLLLYLVAAALILDEHLETMQFIASPAQLSITALVAACLAGAAFLVPRRNAFTASRVPPPWLVGCIALAVLAAHQMVPSTWAGVAATVLLLGVSGLLLLYWSGHPAWSRRHVLAAAGAALMVNAGFSFLVQPLGNSSSIMKYVSNAAILLGVLALIAWAYDRLRQAEKVARLATRPESS